MTTSRNVEQYRKWREDFKPTRGIKHLLLGESPPDPGKGQLRYFYNPKYAHPDNLVRGVARAVYPRSISLSEGENKRLVLEWLQDNGYWLIDAVEYPINKLPDRERRELIRLQKERIIAECLELAPIKGIVICHPRVYCVLAKALWLAGLNVLHDECLPFPIGGDVDEFVERVREALDVRQ